MNLSKSLEDYIESILVASLKNGEVKSVDIAKDLNVSLPGVNKAMNTLKYMGLITKEPYSKISLTKEGKILAEQIYHKHTSINQFLLNLGVSQSVADEDCCKIEHVISDETFQKILEFNKKFEK